MATMYSPKTGKETPGEALVYEKLKSLLPEEYFVLSNQVMPGKDREIDFVIVHRIFGVWIVEVKDWQIDQFQPKDSATVELRKGRILGIARTSSAPNPLAQARDNGIAVRESMQRHSILLNKDGSHQGKLVLPVNTFAAFPNVTRTELTTAGYDDFFPAAKVWTKDFIQDPYIEDAAFERQLLNTREVRFQTNLDDSQLNAVKRSVGIATVPVIRPATGNSEPSPPGDLPTLDHHQNYLARYKIQSKLAIEGPAGSGKSVVLLRRALHIHEEYRHWRIGILCFNALMANYLKTLLRSLPEGTASGDAIDIYDVYDWVKLVGLKSRALSNIDGPETLALELNRAGWRLERQYDALLVDEGQDSTPLLFRLYREMLLRDDCSFTFFYDPRQTLYSESIIDNLSASGFEVDQKPLVKQHRSLLVVLALAFYGHVKHGNSPEDAARKALEISKTWFERFSGWVSTPFRNIYKRLRDYAVGTPSHKVEDLPIAEELDAAIGLTAFTNAEALAKHIADRAKQFLRAGICNERDISILIPSKTYGPGLPGRADNELRTLITRELKALAIAYTTIDRRYGKTWHANGEEVEHKDSRRFADLSVNSVKIMTIHASKGYDSQYVLIAGFDGIQQFQQPEALGYVALTRAKRRCEVFYHENTDTTYVPALKEVLDQLRKGSIQYRP